MLERGGDRGEGCKRGGETALRGVREGEGQKGGC